jgi:hypothetical protein
MQDIQFSTRTILAHTLYPKASSDLLGFIQPLGELIEGNLAGIDQDRFCPTMKVFITSRYDELEKQFPEQRLFEIDIRQSTQTSDNVNPEYACKYVSSASEARPVKPKDYFEVIHLPLPDNNNRTVTLSFRPSTTYIFVDDGTNTYGPLKWVELPSLDGNINIRLDFIDAPLPSVKLVTYQIYRVDSKAAGEHCTISNDRGNERAILRGLSVIKQASFFDYASDDEVVRFCSKLASEHNPKIVEKSKFDNLSALLKKNPKLDVPLIRQRLSRLSDIVKTTTEIQDVVVADIANYLNSDAGQGIVSAFVRKNEERYLGKLRDERERELNTILESKVAEIRLSEARLKDLGETKKQLNDEVQTLVEKAKQGVNLESAYADADAQLKDKRKELDRLEELVKSKAGLVDNLVTIENIEEKLTAMKYQEQFQWKAQESLRTTTAELKSELQKHDDALRKRLTDLRPFVEAINGAFTPGEGPIREVSVKTWDTKSNDATVVRQRNVIDVIQHELAARGRDMDDWEIANILISTQQSFTTFFAGLPGVGKTSLCRLIADVQGIRSRLQEVSVARGWTSQKDLIGFFNPLTSRFQPSSTGIYSFLSALAKEKEQNAAMAYILLDEANLSPIEHYWSAFMGMTDGEGERSLMLGQDRIQIPETLRFLATINYDGTTEPLSPRVVDRAPIIVLSPRDIATVSSHNSSEAEPHLPLSAEQMKELFGNAKGNPPLEDAEASVLNKIKRTLLDPDVTRGKPISISPRKELAIRQYCAKARGIMNAENDFLALDIAVLQHILPLIRGSGAKFAKRLDTLKRELEVGGLPNSAEYTARMLASGEADLHTYDFFCW